MQYASFPMPPGYPDYLSHRLIARYLDDFTDHFGFRGAIRFRTEVTGVVAADGGGWDVTVRSRDGGAQRTARYGAVLVANGHHWDPRCPVLPGAAGFTGVQLHSHHYRTPEPFAGKRVLVVGFGNSAADIAADCAPVAARTVLAVRRGTHIIPGYLFGMPTDRLTRLRLGAAAPLWLRRLAVATLVRAARGPAARYGLPTPGHRMLCAPPTVSDSLPGLVAGGQITVRPGIDRFAGPRVFFTDGSAERVDAVIYATGYKISFPFLAGALARAGDTEPPLGSALGLALYRRVVPPSLPSLYFIGLIQPVGATMPLAEAQSHWVADLIEGRAELPPAAQMYREIAAYRTATAKRYGASARHLIQVDFLAYQREIGKERKAGTRRAEAA
jgi:hypothetical protein